MIALAAAGRRLQPLPLVSLTIVWVLLWGNVSVGNVVAGLLVAAFVLIVFPLPPVTFGVRVRPGSLVVLLAVFFADVVRASLQVSYKAVAPWVQPRPCMLRVPLRSRHDLFTTLTAQMVSLVPGSVVVDIDRDRHELLLHVFDAPAAVDAEKMYDEVLAQEARVLRALSARVEEILSGTADGSEDAPQDAGESHDPGSDGADSAQKSGR